MISKNHNKFVNYYDTNMLKLVIIKILPPSDLSSECKIFYRFLVQINHFSKRATLFFT